MFGSDGIKYVRRPKGERFVPKYQMLTVKHGEKCLMVGFSSKTTVQNTVQILSKKYSI